MVSLAAKNWPRDEVAMKRLRIGISANYMGPQSGRSTYAPKTLIYGEKELYHWVEKGGAIPYMIPPLAGVLKMSDIVQDLDGVLFSGGADVSPQSYGEEALRPEWAGDYERDQYEIELFHAAREAGKPILGICRGHQLINVALGGTMYQDTATQKEGAHLHRDAEIYDGLMHDIEITENSILAQIYPGIKTGKTNSIHHQAVKDLGQGLRVEARSLPDDLIEAIWLEDQGSYVMGVQWHPEWVQDADCLDPDKIRDHYLHAVNSQR